MQIEKMMNIFHVQAKIISGGVFMLITACMLLLPCGAASGSVFYVSPSGSHSLPYDSWATAATNIAAAVEILRDGDIIRVGDGTYVLAQQVVITNSVTVIGENGSTNAIVDGNGADRCFYLGHSGAVLDGLTIRNGKAVEGGGVYIRNAGTVQNCAILSNQAPSGGGVFCYYGGLVQDSLLMANIAMTTNVNPAGNFFYGGAVNCHNGGTVQNCLIISNAVTSEYSPPDTSYFCYGGGVYSWHAGTIQNCVIEGNRAVARNSAAGGGVYLHEGSDLRTCVLSGNRASAAGSAFPTGEGGGVYIDLGGNIESCTIARNIALGEYNGAGGGIFTFRITNQICNTIIYFNNAATNANIYNDGSDVQYAFCSSDPQPLGTGNVTGNPLFVSLAGGNYHLQPASACIDSGNNASAPLFDLDFIERPQDGTGRGTAITDMGAYEYTTNRLGAPAGVLASDGLYCDHVRVSWDSVSGATCYDVWRNTNGNYLAASRIAENITETYCDDIGILPDQLYYYWVKARTGGFSAYDTGYLDMACALAADFDGDAKADPVVYNTNGTWKVKLSGAGYTLITLAGFLGDSGATALAADFDGDRLADPGIYYASSKLWAVKLSSLGYLAPTVLTSFGGSAWQAVAGDFDGDRLADPALYNTNGTWKVRLSTAGYATVITEGLLGFAGWTAIAADFDGDGKVDPAIYQASGGSWTVLMSKFNYSIVMLEAGFLGSIGYIGLAADFDGDGIADPAAVETCTGNWKIKLSGAGYSLLNLSGFLPE